MMIVVFLRVIALLFFISASITASDLRNDVDSLKEYSIDDSREVEIENLEIQLVQGKVVLKNGVLYLTGYFNDLPTAAFFLGDGSFFYEPPDEIEAQQVRRFYDSDTVFVEFNQAYFAFPWNSSLFYHLYNKGQIKNPSYKVKTLFNHIREVPDKKFKYNLPFHVLKASIENHPDFLWVDVLKERFQHTIYFYNPYSREQVSIHKHSPNFKKPQVVSSVEDEESSRVGGVDTEFNLFKYDINVAVSTYTKSRIRCKMFLEIQTDSLKYVVFSLPSKYRVDSVWGAGREFIKEKDRPELIIELSRFFYNGDTVEVDVGYRVNLFRHYMEYGVVQDDLTRWYPYSGYRYLSDYDIEYTIDKGYDFISVGEKITDTVAGRERVLRYRSTRPIAYISFNYGIFDSLYVEESNIPMTIYFLEKRHKSPIFGRRDIRNVVDDVAGSFRFYNNSFIHYPFNRLDVVAMSTGYGQGSPGVVHLSEATFNRSRKGVDDKFRAHEVAHQWWGHLINPAGYRDVWLSEGFAEYSAAMYIQMAKGDEKTFRDILKDWKNKVVQSGKLSGKRSIGFKAGSVILGHRLGSELSPGDYEALVYYKAAYILHMLRFELEWSLAKKGEFLDLLASFADKFAGGLVTTNDFIDVTKQYLGDRTEQFFRQWLYDWRVPKIKKEYSKNDDGSVDILIVLDEVDDDFMTPYPIRFNLSDGVVKALIYNIQAGENLFHFTPGDGSEVKSVRFNPDYDILEQ